MSSFHKNYVKWLTEKVIPNLQLESVFIVDNASYHSVQIERNPNFSWRKANMQKWPRERGIFYEVHERKPELYKKIQVNKPIHKKSVMIRERISVGLRHDY